MCDAVRASAESVAVSFSRAEPAGREVVEVMPPAETARPGWGRGWGWGWG